MRTVYTLFFVLVLLTSLGSASATTMMVTCNVVSSPTELNANILCPQFNGVNLQSIALTVDGMISGSITLTNNGAASNTGTGTTTSGFLVGPLTGFTLASPLFSAMFSTGSQSLTAGQSKTFSGLTGTGMATATDTTVLSPYEGAGNFMVPVLTSTGLMITGGGGNFAGSQSTNAQATASIVYTFGATVPEVSTLGYLSTGLGAILVGLWRRRSART